MLRTGRLPAPHRGRSSPASTPGSRPTPGAALPGTLASPRAGLPPAGCRELVARLRRGALLSMPLGARAAGRTFRRNPAITSSRSLESGDLPIRALVSQLRADAQHGGAMSVDRHRAARPAPLPSCRPTFPVASFHLARFPSDPGRVLLALQPDQPAIGG